MRSSGRPAGAGPRSNRACAHGCTLPLSTTVLELSIGAVICDRGELTCPATTNTSAQTTPSNERTFAVFMSFAPFQYPETSISPLFFREEDPDPLAPDLRHLKSAATQMHNERGGMDCDPFVCATGNRPGFPHPIGIINPDAGKSSEVSSRTAERKPKVENRKEKMEIGRFCCEGGIPCPHSLRDERFEAWSSVAIDDRLPCERDARALLY